MNVLQVTRNGWLGRTVRQFDADICTHEITPSGHLIVRCPKGVVYAASPGTWHEVAVISESQAARVRSQMEEVPA